MTESVEGLWVMYVGDVYAEKFTPGDSAAGVIVLDTNRLYGGDGAFYWTGRYVIDHDVISGTARVCHYNGTKETVFGMPATEYDVRFHGSRHAGGNIVGAMQPLAGGAPPLPFILVKKVSLP